jgi:hypothetical protein
MLMLLTLLFTLLMLGSVGVVGDSGAGDGTTTGEGLGDAADSAAAAAASQCRVNSKTHVAFMIAGQTWFCRREYGADGCRQI